MTDKPNILYILADDMGWGDVSYHGSPIRTPNIDRLVANGVELNQHYVCPMCTPTRAALMTGRHPGRFGRHATVPSNDPVVPTGYETLATALHNVGYQTGLFGKWHLGSDMTYNPREYGFDYAYGSLAGGVDPYNHHYKRGPHSTTWHRNGEPLEERGHVTDLITREAISWMESQSGPWFAYVPFTAVHVPVDAPHAWLDQYAFEKYDDDALKDASFKRYAAYASHMDWAIGEMIDSLKQTGSLENTIVVFSSDNGAISAEPLHHSDQYPGWHFDTPRLGSNAPWRGQKATLYEGGIRTPTVISWPGTLPQGRFCDTPLHVTDWMPTFCALTGASTTCDPRWDGRNIWPVLTGESGGAEDFSFFWNFKGTQFALREGDWKLIQYTGPEETLELYNLADDPREENNRASDCEERVAQMQKRIMEQREMDNTSVHKAMQ